MSKRKLVLLVFSTLVVGAALAAGIYLVQQQQLIRPKAVPATTLTMVASVSKPLVGDTFTVDIQIDSGGNQIQTAELHISYDAGPILATDIAAGSFVANPTVLSQSVSASGANLVLLVPLGEAAQGTGTLATITFTAQQLGPSALAFEPTTKILAIGEDQQNVLTSSIGTTVDVDSAQAAPTSTPTPAPTQPPGAAATSTPAPTTAPSSSVITATPTPAALPQAGVVEATVGVLAAAAALVLLGLLLL